MQEEYIQYTAQERRQFQKQILTKTENFDDLKNQKTKPVE